MMTLEGSGVVLTFGEGTLVAGDAYRPRMWTPLKVSHDKARNRHERRREDALRRRAGLPPVVRVSMKG